MPPVARACPACQTPLPELAHFCNNCGAPTPTDPDVPPRTTGAHDVGELAKVRRALKATYKIERALGAGGMATVYLAEDPKHSRKVAVKVMRPELAATLGAERFLREVEIAAGLSHPHILPVHDSGQADGLLYYVMPYVEGQSLQERLAKDAQLPVEDALRIAREVTDALACAHERDIIHRDIKPANIMLSRGHALVADFGIARAMSGGAAITATGLAIGTPQYMSPEQSTGGGGVDGRSDIYAVGCVLYEMLAGEPPFNGPTAQAIIARSLSEQPRALGSTRAGLPPALDGIVSKALAKNPADRYQTAEALGKALEDPSASSSPGYRPPDLPTYRPADGPSGTHAWALFAFVALVTLGLFYGMVNTWGLPQWVLGLAIGLLAVGAAMLLATGRAEARRRAGTAPAGLGRLLTWKNAALGGLGALAVWAVVVTALVIKGPGGAGPGDTVRLAVLPFENLGAADQAYFVDGVADQVRGKLTGLGGFQVTARASSSQYRGTTKSPQVIGRELGVDYLLGATVMWIKPADGNGRVQVSPELIDVRTGAAKWQQSFDAGVTDVFQVQGTIASQVAGALGVALGSTERQQLGERPTRSLAAYDAYLKGRAITSNAVARLREAASFYEQAVALDSSFVEAWAALSNSLSLMYNNGVPDPALGVRALAAAERVRRLAPEGAAGHYVMARYHFFVTIDNPKAAQEIALALARAPNDADIVRGAATIYQTLGRWDEALELVQRARRLDPRSPSVLRVFQSTQAYLHHYPAALEAGTAALALDPTAPSSTAGLALVHLMMGDLAGARAVIRAAPASVPPADLVAYLATYNDLFWVLDDEQQKLVLQLPPSSFDGDRSNWALVRMQTHWVRGDVAQARVYADSARINLEAQLKAAPGNWQRQALSALALAVLGRKADAVREGLRASAIVPIATDQTKGTYAQYLMIRVYITVGEPEKALDLLEELLKYPWLLTPAWLRIDPAFAPLKGNPRFEKLIAQ